MNNYCIYLKKRKNKPYCKLINKEINLSLCKECDNKEYKKSTSIKKSPVTSGLSNNSKMRKNAQSLTNNRPKKAKMHNKSKKLTKLERNRYSVFTDDLEHCYLCGKKKEDLHEVYAGRNRLNSIKYNFVLPLCRKCHSQEQNNPTFNNYWHKQGQIYWEKFISTREDFIKVFRRNYLK